MTTPPNGIYTELQHGIVWENTPDGWVYTTLNPCPTCPDDHGCPSIHFVEQGEWSYWRVACLHCNSIAVEKPTPQEAISEWNEVASKKDRLETLRRVAHMAEMSMWGVYDFKVDTNYHYPELVLFHQNGMKYVVTLDGDSLYCRGQDMEAFYSCDNKPDMAVPILNSIYRNSIKEYNNSFGKERP